MRGSRRAHFITGRAQTGIQLQGIVEFVAGGLFIALGAGQQGAIVIDFAQTRRAHALERLVRRHTTIPVIRQLRIQLQRILQRFAGLLQQGPPTLADLIRFGRALVLSENLFFSGQACGGGQPRGAEKILHSARHIVADLHVLVGHRLAFSYDGENDLALAALPRKRLGHPLLAHHARQIRWQIGEVAVVNDHLPGRRNQLHADDRDQPPQDDQHPMASHETGEACEHVWKITTRLPTDQLGDRTRSSLQT